jgi:hypothetical protein
MHRMRANLAKCYLPLRYQRSNLAVNQNMKAYGLLKHSSHPRLPHSQYFLKTCIRFNEEFVPKMRTSSEQLFSIHLRLASPRYPASTPATVRGQLANRLVRSNAKTFYKYKTRRSPWVSNCRFVCASFGNRPKDWSDMMQYTAAACFIAEPIANHSL